MKTIWEITQDVKTLPTLHNPLLLEGLPGIGNVGKIVADFLVEELKAIRMYTFFSHKFPHSVFVNEHNLVDMPTLELYYKKFNGNSSKRDLLILTGDIQPIDEESCYSFCEEIIKIAKEFNCSKMITTGGIGLQSVPDKPRVFCTGNDAKMVKEYSTKDLSVEPEIFGVVGPIVGVSGILIGLGKKRNLNGVALLAETFGHPMYLGIKGAKEILRVLDQKFKYNLDLKRMSKEIIEVEKELMKKTKEWAEEVATAAGAKLKKKEASYIG